MRNPLDAPFDALEGLPRSLWLPVVMTSAGRLQQRLNDTPPWLNSLLAGELPAFTADFGDPQAVQPLRDALQRLGLPLLCKARTALAEQVLRTLFWHLDRIVSLQPRLPRDQAVQAVTESFQEAWQLETQGLEPSLALLQTLGDYSALRWDAVRGHLRSSAWQEAERAAQRLAQMPALAALINSLGRAERRPQGPEAALPGAERAPQKPAPARSAESLLPDAPGAITGLRFSRHIERMLGSEAVMLRHPVYQKLWRARFAEARLLSWETQAELREWQPDPLAPRAPLPPPQTPQGLERGPIILCLDTSGSMRGAPQLIAKAVVIAALRVAHTARRACLLIAFGGPGELVEAELGQGGPGLDSLMALMGQAFEGGTDVQAPIERAIDLVHGSHWQQADLLIVSDGEFGCVPRTLQRLDEARLARGLRVQGVLVGDRETMGLMELCDHIHWVRDWRRFGDGEDAHAQAPQFSPVHSASLTALYFPNALSARAARHGTTHKS